MNLRLLIISLLVLSYSCLISGQSDVQIIHNSPSLTVDIWINGESAITDFEFRTATGFLELPSDELLTIGIAPAGSSDSSEAIAVFELTLTEGQKYVVVANGIVGDSMNPFNLEILTPARSEGIDPDLIDITVFHGSPDAPSVDIAAGQLLIIENLSFGEFEPYLSVPATFIPLTIFPAGDSDPVAGFAADLAGLEGEALTVFASGFLDGSEGDPGFGLFAALSNGTVVELPAIGSANVQLFHNSPNQQVDVYLNGELAISEFDFQTATSYFQLPSNFPIEVGIALSPSNSADDIIATFDFILETGQLYFIAANGIVGDDDKPFNLEVFNPSRIFADDQTLVDFNVFHGSPDAPAVDVTSGSSVILAENLSFGEFSDYATVSPQFYQIDISPAGSDDIILSYGANLTNFEGLGFTVVASGYLEPEEDQPEFSLLAVVGNGLVLPLPQVGTAELQIVHNSPSPDVDIYLNGEKVIEQFEYRSATPYLEIPAGVTSQVAIAAFPSESPADAFFEFSFEFEIDQTYLAVASGIEGDAETPFSVDLFGAFSEADDDDEVLFFIYHGASDAPAVDAIIRPDFVAADNLEFRQRTGYLTAPPAAFLLDINAAGTTNTVASYFLNLEGLGGQSAMVFASGLIDPVAGQAGFGLFAALPDGTVVEFDELGAPSVQIIHNSPSPVVDIWLDGEKILSDFEFRSATPFIELPGSGGTYEIGVAPAPSNSPSDIIASFEVEFQAGDTYVAIANGIVGDANTPFSIEIFSDYILGTQPNFTNVLAFHGSPNVPSINIGVLDPNDNEVFLIEDFEFGEFEGQFGFPSQDWRLAIRLSEFPEDDVAIFSAPLSQFVNRAITVFASGFLGSDEPLFGLFAALEDGTVIALELLTNVNEIFDLADLGVFPNPANHVVNIGLPSDNYSPDSEVLVFNMSGKLMDNFRVDNQLGQVQLDVSGYLEGMYLVTIVSGKEVWSGRVLINR